MSVELYFGHPKKIVFPAMTHRLRISKQRSLIHSIIDHWSYRIYQIEVWELSVSESLHLTRLIMHCIFEWWYILSRYVYGSCQLKCSYDVGVLCERRRWGCIIHVGIEISSQTEAQRWNLHIIQWRLGWRCGLDLYLINKYKFTIYISKVFSIVCFKLHTINII